MMGSNLAIENLVQEPPIQSEPMENRLAAVRVWTLLFLVVLSVALLGACRTTQSTSLRSETESSQSISVTPDGTATPNAALAQASTSTPAPSPTFTSPTTPKPIMSATEPPDSALSVTPEDPPNDRDREDSVERAANLALDSLAKRTFVGAFHNLQVNWEGQIHLEARGGAVYASLQTVRSPVQYLARQRPEILFTIPEDFRPASPITWEVSGQQVDPDGHSDPDQQDLRIFRLHVDTKGHVRYVDDSGVDGVGFLRYQTALAWPLAGTDPMVCERSRAIRSRILAALLELGEGALSCNQVDWEHLSRIQTWTTQEPTTIQHFYQRPAVWQWMSDAVIPENEPDEFHVQKRFIWPPFRRSMWRS